MHKRADGSDHFVISHELMVCTLFEGDYHLGLAALVNSLIAHDFKGCIAVGYRGALPPWVDQLTRAQSVADANQYQISDNVQIKFVTIDTAMHLANFKPFFMRRLLSEHPTCKYIWYFDPDIVVRCSWEFFVQWVKYGICLCEDVTNGTMPTNHPIRCRWIELATLWGLVNPVKFSRYYNSGFVGLPASSAHFLEVWESVIDSAQSSGVSMTAFGIGTRMSPFYGVDQDAMNVAAMYAGLPLTTVGPEGMDLVPGGFTMYHAIGSPKPWRKNMLLSAIKGVPPSGSDKAFLANLVRPIRVYTTTRLAVKRLSCNAAALIGRFYRRG